MKYKMFLFFALAVFSIGCKEEVLPKPKAMLRLEYPTADYQTAETDCVYTFDQNSLSNIKENKDCSLVLDYPMMKGSIYLNLQACPRKFGHPIGRCPKIVVRTRGEGR